MTGSRPLILIVDDSATMRSIVKVHLTEIGADFREAASAEAALQVCASEPVSLLVLDRNLPGMSGVALTRQLRAGPMAGVPVILLTGDPSPAIEQEAIEAGVQAFVRKPVNQSGLTETVRRLLGR
jgi:two-component system chemotaxis response regulator CheY